MAGEISDWSVALLKYFASPAIAAGVTAFVAKKLFEARLERSIEELKQKHAHDMARLNSTLGALSKLQEKEFEILPKLWEMLDRVHRQIGAVVSGLQRLPNLDDLPDAELDEFLAKLNLTIAAKTGIREAKGHERMTVFGEIYSRMEVAEAERAVLELRGFIEGNEIFLPPGLPEECKKFVSLGISAVADKQTGLETRAASYSEARRQSPEFFQRAREAHAASTEIHARVRDTIRDRLWHARKVAEGTENPPDR